VGKTLIEVDWEENVEEKVGTCYLREVTGRQREKERHNLYSSSRIIRRIRWLEHVACMTKIRNIQIF
jgi:hypothetical protein